MTGVHTLPASSLAARAVALLEAGPADSAAIVREVLQLPRTRRQVADRLATTLLGQDPRIARRADGRWTLAGAGAKSPRLDKCRFAVVDVETTGASPGSGGRIIEIAVAVLDDGHVSIALETVVNPGTGVPPVVRALTGITATEVARAPAFGAIADQVLGALAGAVFVGHNVRHDWSFVAGEVMRARDLLLAGPRLCTLKLARRLLPVRDGTSLDAVALALGIEVERRHRAGGDAYATARVLQRLLGIARDLGAVTLDDLYLVKA